MMNDVTVVIAAKDAAETIGRAIASSLAQPEVVQIIVIDDGSEDETSAAAEAACDGTNRLEIIRFDVNRGPAAARNAGLDRARGEWYTMVDSDDFMDDGRIGRLLTIAENTYDFVADDLWLVQSGREYGDREKMWRAPPGEERRDLTFEVFLEGNIAHKHKERRELGFIKPLIRIERIEQTNLRYRENMRLSEDFVFYSELLLQNCPALLVEPQGYVAVRRRDSLSAQHGTEELQHYYEAIKEFASRPNLTKSQLKTVAQFQNSVARRYRWSKLIDARRTGNLAQAVSAFKTSPDIIALLLKNSLASLAQKLRPSHEQREYP